MDKPLRLWRITGTRGGRLWTMKIRAADWAQAKRLGATRLLLVVRDVVLIEEG
jgi:hypothetical protein